MTNLDFFQVIAYFINLDISYIYINHLYFNMSKINKHQYNDSVTDSTVT